MTYVEAKKIADEIHAALEPHCERIEVVGSVRRKKPDGIKDIEFVIIPKPFDIGLFESGIASVVNRWEKIRGVMNKNCKLTQRRHPSGVSIDLFIAKPENFGYLKTIRTGNTSFSTQLAKFWCKKGYRGKDGYFRRGKKIIPIREEKDLFDLLGLPYQDPEQREYK